MKFVGQKKRGIIAPCRAFANPFRPISMRGVFNRRMGEVILKRAQCLAAAAAVGIFEPGGNVGVKNWAVIEKYQAINATPAISLEMVLSNVCKLILNCPACIHQFISIWTENAPILIFQKDLNILLFEFSKSYFWSSRFISAAEKVISRESSVSIEIFIHHHPHHHCHDRHQAWHVIINPEIMIMF